MAAAKSLTLENLNRKLMLRAQVLEITGSVYGVRPNKTREGFLKMQASNFYTAIAVIFQYGSLKV